MPKNAKKPQIRFKGFTDAWEQRKLGEFGKATSGTSIEAEFVHEGKYKVINIGSYSEISQYIDQGIRVNKTEKIMNRILNKDDLTMILNDKTSKGNIIGRVLLIDADDTYVYNQRTERIEVYKDLFEPNFIYQLLNAENIRKKIISSAQGNTQIYINWSVISNFNYFVPLTKSEQKHLANFFDYFDNLITLHQRKLDKLKNIKKSMLEKMFPKNGSNIPEIRFKGFTDAWEQRKLGDVGEIITGSTPSTLHPEYYSEEGLPWVTPTDINQNIIFNTDKKLSIYGEKVSRIVPPGSILVTCIASIGKNAMLTTAGSFNQQINGLIPNFKNYNSYFLLTASFLWSAKMIKEAAAGTMQIVNKNEFTNINTYIPTLKEQKIIGAYFNNLDNLITLHQRKLEKLQNIKKACLEKMFV